MKLTQHLFPADPAARARRDRILVVLFWLFALVLIVRAYRKDGGVLLRNQAFGERFLAGEDPYYDREHDVREHGPYPPSLVLVAVPLSFLPSGLARIVWAGTQVLALVAAYRILRRWAREHWSSVADHAPVLFAAALLLVSRYLLRDTAGGGGNLLYTVLVLAGLDLAWRERELLSGLPIALSLVLKPNLAPLVLFLACRRRFRSVASALALTLVLYCLPATIYGAAKYRDLSLGWARDVIAFVRLDDMTDRRLVPAGMPPAEWGMNQNLRESVHRLLRPVGDTQAPDVHLVETSPAVASWLARGLSFVLVVVCLHAAWRARAGRSERLVAMAFLPLAMLTSPVTWKAHHTDLLALFFLLAACAAEGRRWNKLTVALAVYWLVCDLASEEVLGNDAKELLQSLGLVAWWDIALLFTVLALARRPDPAGAAAPADAGGRHLAPGGDASIRRGPPRLG